VPPPRRGPPPSWLLSVLLVMCESRISGILLAHGRLDQGTDLPHGQPVLEGGTQPLVDVLAHQHVDLPRLRVDDPAPLGCFAALLLGQLDHAWPLSEFFSLKRAVPGSARRPSATVA